METEVVIIRQHGKYVVNVQFTVVRQSDVVELGSIQFEAFILWIRRNQSWLTLYEWEHSINSWIVISRFVGEAQHLHRTFRVGTWTLRMIVHNWAVISRREADRHVISRFQLNALVKINVQEAILLALHILRRNSCAVHSDRHT